MADLLTPAGTSGRVFARLVHVELRKLVDTRASRSVLLSTTTLALAVALLGTLGRESDGPLEAASVIGAVQAPMALAMAVIGILGMTGDWDHRVTTTYFPLVRSRTAIYVAKICATLIMSGILLVALALASLVVLGVVGLTSGAAVSLPGLGGALLAAGGASLFGTVFGLRVAAVVRRSALSLVLVVLLTIGINGVVLTLLPEDLQPVFSTLTPLVLLGDADGPAVAAWQVVCSLALWYVAPLGAGWRIAARVKA